MDEQTTERTVPSVDRAWELLERAYGRNEVRVLGWADNGVMQPYKGRLRFDVTDAVRHSHEDEVIIVAIVVPHPDEMTLEEVINGRPCSCGGKRWVDDENWSPPFRTIGAYERTPHDGLIPCGFCNEGGWNAPVGVTE